MRSPRRAAPLALSIAVVSLAGCGNDRFEPRSLNIAPSESSRTLRYPPAGLTVDIPQGFGVKRGRYPSVFRATLGESFISAFVYRRAEQLPRDDAELTTARQRLERTIRERSKGYELRSSRNARAGGARTAELVGEQTLSQRRFRIRSLHVFKGQAEYVIELAAPVKAFSRLDRVVTPLLKRTLKVSGEVRRPAARRPRR